MVSVTAPWASVTIDQQMLLISLARSPGPDAQQNDDTVPEWVAPRRHGSER
jgi:hypothetical protein